MADEIGKGGGDRRKVQLPLVKCEDGVERYTRDNEDGVMRWDERTGPVERRRKDWETARFYLDTVSGVAALFLSLTLEGTFLDYETWRRKR